MKTIIFLKRKCVTHLSIVVNFIYRDLLLKLRMSQKKESDDTTYNTYWFHYIGGITLKEFLLVSGCLRFAYEGYEVNLFATIEFPDIVDENTTYYDVLSDKLVIEML